MFQNGFEIGRVFGVPIRLDWSLIILALYFALFSGSLVVGVVTSFLLMLSVALHELGHTYTALKFGCRVHDITLMLIGGRASLLDMPREPWKEFVLAASGPLVSAVLWLGARRLAPLAGGSPVLVSILLYMALVNKMLLLFNLLPAFPMDGGRMFRALLARRMGRLRATFIASRVGRVAAVLFGIAGIFRFDIFLFLIAVFIYQTAGMEYRMVQAEAGIGGGFFGDDRPPPDDQVYISPPPYRQGRDVADVFKDH